jgi:hypothetical protein
MGLQALLPQAPDRTHQVAFEGTDGRPFGLARAQAAGHVVLGRRPTAQLRQGHAVEEGLEPAVAPTGEAVADPPGRGGLPGRDAGLGGHLGVTAEAPARFQDAGARPRGAGRCP